MPRYRGSPNKVFSKRTPIAKNTKKSSKVEAYQTGYRMFPLRDSLCALCVFVVIFFSIAGAQKRNSLGWVWQNPLPQGNPLYSIHFAKDKEIGYSVGSDGTILRTGAAARPDPRGLTATAWMTGSPLSYLTAGHASAGRVLTTVADATALSTSSRVIRPLRPVPWIRPGSIPCCAQARRTDGERRDSTPSPFPGEGRGP